MPDLSAALPHMTWGKEVYPPSREDTKGKWRAVAKRLRAV
jgi:hypothetical protein